MSFAIEMQDVPKLVDGYPKLAQRMSTTPETAILRRFSNLNMQSILYYQAELIHLETTLRELEVAASMSEDDRAKRYARDWAWLGLLTQEGKDEQWQTVLAIRKTLKEYNEAVIQQVTMATLPKPDPHDLQDLQIWLRRPKMGNRALIGADCGVWGEEHSPGQHGKDLFVLRPRQAVDPFSKWVTHKCIVWLHHHVLRPLNIFKGDIDPETGIATYKEESLFRIGAFIGSLLASMLPVAAIAVLYRVSSVPGRVGVIAAFNLVFCICLSQFTTAKRVEMFAAAAAFTAVQVVFVGTN